METLYINSTKLRPNIHYLDLIAKIYSNKGKVFNLSIEQFENESKVMFCHSYKSSNIIFSEEIIYNKKNEIIKWNVFIKNNEDIENISIYSENI